MIFLFCQVFLSCRFQILLLSQKRNNNQGKEGNRNCYQDGCQSKRMSQNFPGDPDVSMLLQYDKENNSCYMETLRTYLRSRNIVTAAGELHIHRNTMNYRIQKIEEITHLNLNEGDDLYKLWFSLLILEMKEL